MAALLASAAGCAGPRPWGPTSGCASCAYRPEQNAAAPAGPAAAAPANPSFTIRGQSPTDYQPGSPNYLRDPQPVSGGAPQTAGYPAANFGAPPAGGYTPPPYQPLQPGQPNVAYQPGVGPALPPPG